VKGLRQFIKFSRGPNRVRASRSLTFAVAGVISQHRALFDRSKRLKQQPDVVFVLLLVQHSDKQLPVFYNRTSPTRCLYCRFNNNF